mmetsp:Transcript_16847/g.46474  ORF Transcript_16847/g.46474 Transcript_16847/m.46474 type:complete len:217 (+) Transcript_16847:1721-2371(+)
MSTLSVAVVGANSSSGAVHGSTRETPASSMSAMARGLMVPRSDSLQWGTLSTKPIMRLPGFRFQCTSCLVWQYSIPLAASSATLMSTRSEFRKSARRLMAEPNEQPLRNSATSAGRCSWPSTTAVGSSASMVPAAAASAAITAPLMTSSSFSEAISCCCSWRAKSCCMPPMASSPLPVSVGLRLPRSSSAGLATRPPNCGTTEHDNVRSAVNLDSP